MVTREHSVITHAAPRTLPAPDLLVRALLAREDSALRSMLSCTPSTSDACVSISKTQLTGSYSAWLISENACSLSAASCDALVTSLSGPARWPNTPWLGALLEPRLGPLRQPHLPPHVLYVAPATDGAALLDALSEVRGRVGFHRRDDWAFAAILASDERPHAVHRGVTRHPHLRIGIASTPTLATEWPSLRRWAELAAAHAVAEDLQLVDLRDTDTLADVVTRHARTQMSDLERGLPNHPTALLQAHDELARAQLLPTLLAWLDHNCDVQATAAAMYTHVNTLRYRLRRASHITGINLTSQSHLLALRLLAPDPEPIEA